MASIKIEGMKRKIFKIPKEVLISLKKLKGIKIFSQDEDFLPKNKIPNSALVILEGRACLLKNDSEFIDVNPGYGLAFDDFNLRAKKDLKAIVLEPEDFDSKSPVGSLLRGFLGMDIISPA